MRKRMGWLFVTTALTAACEVYAGLCLGCVMAVVMA